MPYNTEFLDHSIVIHVGEDLDMASTDDLDAVIAHAETATSKRIVVSLENCDYCDSSGLRVFIKAWNRLDDRFSVAVPKNGKCYKVFDVTGIGRLPFVFGSVSEAVDSEVPDS